MVVDLWNNRAVYKALGSLWRLYTAQHAVCVRPVLCMTRWITYKYTWPWNGVWYRADDARMGITLSYIEDPPPVSLAKQPVAPMAAAAVSRTPLVKSRTELEALQKINDLEDQLTTAQASIQTLRADVKREKQIAEAARKEIETLKAQNRQLTQAASSDDKDRLISALRAEIEEVRAQNRQLLRTPPVAGAGTQAAPAAGDKDEIIKGLRQRITQLEGTPIGKLQRDLDELQKAHAALQQRSMQDSAELADNRARLQDALRELLTMRGGTTEVSGSFPLAQKTVGNYAAIMQQATRQKCVDFLLGDGEDTPVLYQAEVDQTITSIVMRFASSAMATVVDARRKLSMLVTMYPNDTQLVEVTRSVLNVWRARYREWKEGQPATMMTHGASSAEIDARISDAIEAMKNTNKETKKLFTDPPSRDAEIFLENARRFCLKIMNVLWSMALYEPPLTLMVPEAFDETSCQREPASFPGKLVVACSCPAVVAAGGKWQSPPVMTKARVYMVPKVPCVREMDEEEKNFHPAWKRASYYTVPAGALELDPPTTKAFLCMGHPTKQTVDSAIAELCRGVQTAWRQLAELLPAETHTDRVRGYLSIGQQAVEHGGPEALINALREPQPSARIGDVPGQATLAISELGTPTSNADRAVCAAAWLMQAVVQCASAMTSDAADGYKLASTEKINMAINLAAVTDAVASVVSQVRGRPDGVIVIAAGLGQAAARVRSLVQDSTHGSVLIAVFGADEQGKDGALSRYGTPLPRHGGRPFALFPVAGMQLPDGNVANTETSRITPDEFRAVSTVSTTFSAPRPVLPQFQLLHAHEERTKLEEQEKREAALRRQEARRGANANE